MMKRETISIANIYVPTKRRGTLEQKRVDEIAASILDKGLQAPILVRADGARFVLVEGLHRLEAAKAGANRVIHNYGHGGSGVSVCWGCASSVRTLLDELLGGGADAPPPDAAHDAPHTQQPTAKRSGP